MELIKDKIINKSLTLFTQVGVKVVTMDMISKELGISKKTLYEYFSSKEELIKQTFNECLTSSILELENKVKNYHNTIHQKFLILENINSLFFFKQNYILVHLEKFYPEIYYDLISTQKKYLKTLLRNNLSIGVEEGLYRSKINKKLISEFFYLIEQMITDNNNSSELNLKDFSVSNYLIELLIRSIATKKGIKELEKYIKN